MSIPDKSTSGPPRQDVPDTPIAPRKADDTARGQQAAGDRKPQRFSQQQAQQIPSDPDPDDPASP